MFTCMLTSLIPAYTGGAVTRMVIDDATGSNTDASRICSIEQCVVLSPSAAVRLRSRAGDAAGDCLYLQNHPAEQPSGALRNGPLLHLRSESERTSPSGKARQGEQLVHTLSANAPVT